MSHVIEQNQQERPEERLATLMEENFSRVFSLLAPIITFSIQNENHMRQIMSLIRNGSVSQNQSRLGLDGLNSSPEFLLNMLNQHRQRMDYTGPSNQHLLETNHDEDTSEDDEPSTSNVAGLRVQKTEKPFDLNGNLLNISKQSTPKVKLPRKRRLNEDRSDISATIYCPDCKQNFIRGDGTYTRHLKEMKCSPHECPECGKRFKKKNYLNVHIEAHTTGEPVTKIRKTKPKRQNDEIDKTSDVSGNSNDTLDNTAANVSDPKDTNLSEKNRSDSPSNSDD